MPAALGTPPWAISLLPPPRPFSFDNVCFIRAPISWGCPGDCAKTNDGCGDVVATRATTFDDRRVNFWARSFMEFMSRSAKVRMTSLRPSVFGGFGQKRGGLGFGEFFLGLFVLLAEGTDFIERLCRPAAERRRCAAENSAAASVRVVKSRRAVATARCPATNSTRQPWRTFSVLRSRMQPICPVWLT